jgi:hypothetical protein
MYGVIWYVHCVGVLRLLFGWRWSWALLLACPIALGALAIGVQLARQFGVD